MMISRILPIESPFLAKQHPGRQSWFHIVAALLLALTTFAEGSEPMKLVVCAPGYPGSTIEAQPAMDGLAAAITSAAGWSAEQLGAAYYESNEGGIKALSQPDTAFALVTLPFFLEHREAAGLVAIGQAVPHDRTASEPWTLVAGVGSITTTADLNQWELRSLAGHSHRFVRGPALGSWGELPDSVVIKFSGAVLSSLRKAARGEKIAVLLDGQQASALNRLPYADKLETVHLSAPLPVSLLCSIDGRASEDKNSAVLAALLSLGGRPEAADALAGVRLEKFVELDQKNLDKAVAAFEGVLE